MVRVGLDFRDLPGNTVTCQDCGGTSWALKREGQTSYDFHGTRFEGTDAIIVCVDCGLTGRSDGKMADPEGRLG